MPARKIEFGAETIKGKSSEELGKHILPMILLSETRAKKSNKIGDQNQDNVNGLPEDTN